MLKKKEYSENRAIKVNLNYDCYKTYEEREKNVIEKNIKHIYSNLFGLV